MKRALLFHCNFVSDQGVSRILFGNPSQIRLQLFEKGLDGVDQDRK